jgi:WhiB family redox-sensing transcriptional regulator
MAVFEERWENRARCRDMDADLFFPERGENRAIEQAKAVCAQCPVSVDCLTAHLRERDGVWGGTTGNERRKMRRGVLVVQPCPVSVAAVA